MRSSCLYSLSLIFASSVISMSYIMVSLFVVRSSASFKMSPLSSCLHFCPSQFEIITQLILYCATFCIQTFLLCHHCLASRAITASLLEPSLPRFSSHHCLASRAITASLLEPSLPRFSSHHCLASRAITASLLC